MTDVNRDIYEQRYGQANFQLGGDAYSRAIHALRLGLIERYGSGKDVLDVGCATGEYLKPHLHQMHSAIGLDYTQRFLDELAASFTEGPPANLRLVCADARDMPLDSASIDFAYSYATLYSVPDAERAVREIGRVVRPGGHMAIELGNKTSLNTLVAGAWHKAEAWAKPHHVPVTEMRRWVREVGFEVVSWRAFQVLPLYAVPRRLLWLRPLSGQPLRPLLARTSADGRTLDERISSLPGLRLLAFRHLVVAQRR